ncbi:hypothetical protein CQW23_29650 [Capsicum baccatum]|uniref:Uncharacterized protein n=1 Tax=Capsicum baccatum TaxID=33114 RepID=A0A2G2VCL3_CAPBA|nr:hypothetical protein CQW23_29650 [Capsicum baccatum]
MLNLSHNGLEGIIPASLEHLSVLESLDLSSNKIGGEIPQQLASLTFFAVINLSPNHLVGCIPKGKQFDIFENTSYQGNDGLCGFPLSKDCGGNDGVLQATTPVELGCNTPHFGLERKSSFLCVDDPKAINPMQIWHDYQIEKGVRAFMVQDARHGQGPSSGHDIDDDEDEEELIS